MKKCSFLYLLASLLHVTGICQAPTLYSFQKDDSGLKNNYYEQAAKRKDLLLVASKGPYEKDYKEIYDEQFKEIGSLLQSSRSVTDPIAHGYLQAVLQNIVSVNPELKGSDLRVVFSRDWWPNAYSLGEGTIVVNAGLMIYLDNEAQLVFVLCHELAHDYLHHTRKSIQNYVETINSKSYQDQLKRLSKQEFQVSKEVEKLEKSVAFDSRMHSRANEAEADLQGFNFMKKTGYSCQAIRSCLQLLDRIDDSSLYKPLDLSQVFNFSEYPFKRKWIDKETAIFSQLDEKDSPLTQGEKDSLKTHPDCSKRILLLSDSIDKHSIQGNDFLVSEAMFRTLKSDFYKEIMQQCFAADELSRNLYYSLLLYQSNEDTSLAVYSIARCLNRVYEDQKNHKLGLMIDLEDRRYPADYNLLLRMLNRLKLDEIATLNYQLCKKYYEQMKGYPEFMQEVKKLPQTKK